MLPKIDNSEIHHVAPRILAHDKSAQLQDLDNPPAALANYSRLYRSGNDGRLHKKAE